MTEAPVESLIRICGTSPTAELVAAIVEVPAAPGTIDDEVITELATVVVQDNAEPVTDVVVVVAKLAAVIVEALA